jgi:hypothetical protein
MCFPLIVVVRLGRKQATFFSAALLSLSVRGQRYDEILISLGGLRFGENFEVILGEGDCMRSKQCNVGFAYSSSIGVHGVMCRFQFGYRQTPGRRTDAVC